MTEIQSFVAMEPNESFRSSEVKVLVAISRFKRPRLVSCKRPWELKALKADFTDFWKLLSVTSSADVIFFCPWLHALEVLGQLTGPFEKLRVNWGSFNQTVWTKEVLYPCCLATEGLYFQSLVILLGYWRGHDKRDNACRWRASCSSLTSWVCVGVVEMLASVLQHGWILGGTFMSDSDWSSEAASMLNESQVLSGRGPSGCTGGGSRCEAAAVSSTSGVLTIIAIIDVGLPEHSGAKSIIYIYILCIQHWNLLTGIQESSHLSAV